MNNPTNRFTVCLYKSLKEIILFHWCLLIVLCCKDRFFCFRSMSFLFENFIH